MLRRLPSRCYGAYAMVLASFLFFLHLQVAGASLEKFRFPDYLPTFAQQEDCLPTLPKQLPAPVFANDEILEQLRSAANDRGTILFTVFVSTNDDEERLVFSRQLEAWMCRVRYLMGSSFLVFVDSAEAKQYWQDTYGITAVFSEAWMQKAFKDVPESEARDANFWRWQVMELILRAGYSALYADTDMIWLSDPRAILAELPDIDFFGSCDSYDGRTGSVDWKDTEVLDMAALREESRRNDDESVCCQGVLAPINAGLVFMRATDAAITATVRTRQRILSGPCWGQAAMQWVLYELCGNELSCGMLNPTHIASAHPLKLAIKALGSNISALKPVVIHLDSEHKGKLNTYFERRFGSCAELSTDHNAEL